MPCVVTVRSLLPSLTFPFFARLQLGFYAEGEDITATATLARLASEAGVERAAFEPAFETEDMRRATAADFRICGQFGVNEFPGVVLQKGTRYAYLTIGYRPLAQLQPVIDAWING